MVVILQATGLFSRASDGSSPGRARPKLVESDPAYALTAPGSTFQEKLDKDGFRRGLGSRVEEAYLEVLHRIPAEAPSV